MSISCLTFNISKVLKCLEMLLSIQNLKEAFLVYFVINIIIIAAVSVNILPAVSGQDRCQCSMSTASASNEAHPEGSMKEFTSTVDSCNKMEYCK